MIKNDHDGDDYEGETEGVGLNKWSNKKINKSIRKERKKLKDEKKRVIKVESWRQCSSPARWSIKQEAGENTRGQSDSSVTQFTSPKFPKYISVNYPEIKVDKVTGLHPRYRPTKSQSGTLTTTPRRYYDGNKKNTYNNQIWWRTLTMTQKSTGE